MKTALVWFIATLLPITTQAEIFKCTENGQTIYSASPTCNNANQLKFDKPPLPPPQKQALSRKGRIMLQRDARGMFLGNGAVESVPVVFMVDTGATTTTISGRVAHAAGFYSCTPYGTTQTANGTVTKCAINANINFGGFTVQKHLLDVADNMQADMLLGQDILQKLKVQQQNGVMTLSLE